MVVAIGAAVASAATAVGAGVLLIEGIVLKALRIMVVSGPHRGSGQPTAVVGGHGGMFLLFVALLTCFYPFELLMLMIGLVELSSHDLGAARRPTMVQNGRPAGSHIFRETCLPRNVTYAV